MINVKKPIVLCIMDGWGLTHPNPGNAVDLAQTPNLDYLRKTYPNATLLASGQAVGLPKGQMGNSEVGHMNLGAGRIVYTGLSLINKEIANHTFKTKPTIQKLLAEVKKRHAKLHVMGLVSSGGVHSYNDHLITFLKVAYEQNIDYILHAFTDGRDVSPNASLNDFVKLKEVVAVTKGKWGVISGRYYAMDRDQRWERTNLVYEALLNNKCAHNFSDPLTYLQKSHAEGITDEFVLPAISDHFDQKTIADNDVVFFFNFRPDRARQLCHLIKGSKDLYDYQPPKRAQNVYLATMMTYEKILADLIIYPPFVIPQTLGEVLAQNHKKQLRIAETEKYPHVTFFFDGGVEIDHPNSAKVLIPSPKVATYDLQPEMSAWIITEKLLPLLSQYDVIILNYANPDMVGHTGSITATIKAVETVDTQVGIIAKAVNDLNGVCIIIADHGNAEVKLTLDNKPATSHTTNPVPLIITDRNIQVLHDGILADIAPTILEYLGIKKPDSMIGKSLIVQRN